MKPARQRPELRDLVDIPRFLGPRTTVARPVIGTTPAGDPVHLELSSPWTLLLFLTTSCDGCHDLWRAFTGRERPAGGGVQAVVVARASEPAAGVAMLTGPGGSASVVLSDRAWVDYEVHGSPFFVLVEGATARVATEGVAWSVEQIVAALRAAGAGA